MTKMSTKHNIKTFPIPLLCTWHDTNEILNTIMYQRPYRNHLGPRFTGESSTAAKTPLTRFFSATELHALLKFLNTPTPTTLTSRECASKFVMKKLSSSLADCLCSHYLTTRTRPLYSDSVPLY